MQNFFVITLNDLQKLISTVSVCSSLRSQNGILPASFVSLAPCGRNVLGNRESSSNTPNGLVNVTVASAGHIFKAVASQAPAATRLVRDAALPSFYINHATKVGWRVGTLCSSQKGDRGLTFSLRTKVWQVYLTRPTGVPCLFSSGIRLSKRWKRCSQAYSQQFRL